jgi:hypothetical protein
MKLKQEMNNSKCIVPVFILFALSIIAVNAQTQRVSDRQLTNTVRRLERSSAKSRNTLTMNRVSPQGQNDWASVRTNLEALANAAF